MAAENTHDTDGADAVSAREDYPDLAAFTEAINLRDGRRALLEIDMLRSDVAKLLAMCAKADARWINTDELHTASGTQ
jgi:hypothetical protein